MLGNVTVAEGEPAVFGDQCVVGPADLESVAAGSQTWIIDLSGRLGADYVAHFSKTNSRTTLVDAAQVATFNGNRLSFRDFVAGEGQGGDASSVGQARIVLFLPSVANAEIEAVVDRCVASCAAAAKMQGNVHVCVVGSINIQQEADQLSPFELSVISRFRDTGAKTTLVRTGFVVDPSWQWPASLANFCRLYPLVPDGAMGVFLDRSELFSALDRILTHPDQVRYGRVTLLGARRSWRDMLREYVHPCPITTVVTSLAWLLSWLQVGRVGFWLFALLGRAIPAWRRWLFTTLNPTSLGELLSLCHPLNHRHIAVAGYNTGVVHFGWKYPGRTVVRTTGSGRLVRIGNGTITVDAGVLLKRAIRELAAKGQEFYVVPNYSYVSLGTAFMVPVHGSGSDVSTLGETIEQVLVYDPAQDKILRLRRGDDLFGRCLYNPGSGMVVLRLRLRVREQSRYFVKKSELNAPTAADIWQTFSDPAAANIELRKSRAAETTVDVRKFYTTSSGDPDTLEIPRDTIGKLWDRLEENAVTSWAFHTLVRKLGFHVELFLDEREFEIFWKAHATLPLSKLQLRLMKRDALPESPFGDCNRISVDIFMKRKESPAFISFMKEHLPYARFNPGKHSM